VRTCIQWGMAIVVSAAACLASTGASAQDSVSDLKKMVEDLTKRLDEVTKQLEEVETKQEEQDAEQKAAAAAPAAATPAERPKGALDVLWKDGIRLESAEVNENGVKPFQLRITGRLQADAAWTSEDDDLQTVDEAESGFEFRRARMAIGGQIYEDFEFMTEYDFVEGESAFKDVYLGAKNIPVVGTLRVGHYKEYGSLDELTSDNDTLFIERALPNIFAPSRNTGVGVHNAFFEKRMTAGMGVFRDSDDFGLGEGGGNWAFTGRLTGLPYYDEENHRLVHVGMWGSYRNNELEDFRLRARPEVHLAGRYIDTFDQIGAVDSVGLFGAEVGTIIGPFSASAEYMLQMLSREDAGADDATMQGGYIQAGYILTGESREYKTDTGIYGAVKPKKNFQIGEGGGIGAWELALRYSFLDLDDDDIDGGREDNITAGVNWFLNPNMRISMNYVHAWVDRDEDVIVDEGTDDEETFPAIDGNFDGFVTRFQVTW